MRLIINADDLGLNPIVNTLIMQAAREGSITSATILANSNYWDQIFNVIKLNKISFGVHLNITEGESLTKSCVLEKYKIIDSSGKFTNNRDIFNSILPKELKEDLYVELKSQIQLVKDKIRFISHIDGHHHCHTWSGMEEIVTKLLIDFNINNIRNCYVWPISNPIQLFNNRYFKKLLKSKIKTNYFTSYENAVQKVNKYKLFHYLFLRNKTIELMCHPGHNKYENEFELVMKHEFESKLKCNIELISYAEL